MRAGIRIADPDRLQPLPEGQNGEIWLRGPWIGDGYHDRPAETAATFGQPLDEGGAAEWLRTGDLGTLKGDALWITGRLKDVVICNGAKIAATEIEHAACAFDAALNPLAAAAFMPDEARGGQVVVIAETFGGRTVDRTDLAGLKERVARTFLGEWGLELTDLVIVPRGALARTSSGKIQRHAIAEAYRRGGYADPETQSQTGE
ncbi:MAG: AMP-binding protein [Paracoccaceae bacterium]